MSKTELLKARAMQALDARCATLAHQVQRLTCEVEALRQLLDPEKAAAFPHLVVKIRQQAEAAVAEDEANERLRRIAATAKKRES
jgi:hypothetical protein